MNRLKMKSPGAVEGNVARVAALWPHCVAERIGADGKPQRAIDFDKLRAELGDDLLGDGEERYQFTWPDKRAAARLANTPTTKTLRPCRGESVGRDGTPGGFDSENLYIEGDNLDVLKVLRETYLGRVKMIYIDPPYNTGNDFVYNDDFAQSRAEWDGNNGIRDDEGNLLLDPMQRNTESNGRFHTDWLNMIYPRLKVARDLLADDGVIFISIDDNEQDNLRKVCDEIFGGQNFVAQISWRRTDNQPNIGYFARVKDYILLYAKSMSFTLGKLPLSEKAKAEYRYSDAKGLFRRAILLHKTRGRKFYPKVTKLGNTLNGPWMVSEEQFNRMDANGEIYWTENGDGQPYGKIYLSESEGQIPNDFWGIDFGTNQRGSLEVEKLLDGRYFDFPKPVSLLYNLVRLGSSQDSIILDFFSGSATTAHAVMKLNAEDGGHRRFIMVQLPEVTDEKSEARKAGYANICEIGKERIRRAGRQLVGAQYIAPASGLPASGSPAPDGGLFADIDATTNRALSGRAQYIAPLPPTTTTATPTLPDIGFRVFKLDTSNMEDVYYTPEEFDPAQIDGLVDNIKGDRTADDLLIQVMLDLGIELSCSIRCEEIAGRSVYLVDEMDDGTDAGQSGDGRGDGRSGRGMPRPYLAACFDRNINETTIEEMARLHPVHLVIRDAGAATDQVLDNFDQIIAVYSSERQITTHIL